jgi:hypothetical protein
VLLALAGPADVVLETVERLVGSGAFLDAKDAGCGDDDGPAAAVGGGVVVGTEQAEGVGVRGAAIGPEPQVVGVAPAGGMVHDGQVQCPSRATTKLRR